MSEEIEIIETVNEEQQLTFEQFIENLSVSDPKNDADYYSLLDLYNRAKLEASWDIHINVDKLIVKQLLIMGGETNADVTLIIPTVSKQLADRFIEKEKKERKGILSTSSTSGTKSIGREFLDVSYAGGDDDSGEGYRLLFGDNSTNVVGGARLVDNREKMQKIKFNLAGRIVDRVAQEYEITLTLNDSYRAYSRDRSYYVVPIFAPIQVIGMRISLRRIVTMDARTCANSYEIIDSYVDDYRKWLQQLYEIGVILDDYYNFQHLPKSLIFITDNLYNVLFEDYQTVEEKIKALQHAVNILKSVKLSNKLYRLMQVNEVSTEIKRFEFLPNNLPDRELINQDLINEIEQLAKFKLEYKYNPLSTLFNHNYHHIYIRSIAHGVDDKQVQQFLQQLKMNNIIISLNRKNMIENLKQKNYQRFYEQLKNEKYGSTKISTKQKEHLEAEAKKWLDYHLAMMKNRCSHVQVLSQLRRQKSIHDREKSFNNLSKFVSNVTTNKMITCNNCGFEIMCPHEYLLLRNRVKGFKDDMKIIQDFAARVKSTDIVCRICSGRLKKITITDIDVNDTYYQQIEEDDTIAQQLYSDIMSARDFIEFIYPINHNEYMNEAIKVLKPLVQQEDAKLNRNTVLTIEQVRDARRIYISIVAYTYVFLAIVKGFAKFVKNDKSIKFLSKTESLTKVTDAKEVLRILREIILSTRSANYARTINVANYSDKDLIPALVNTYKKISGEKIIKKPSRQEKYERKLRSLMNDPIFQYISRVHGSVWKLEEWVKKIPQLSGNSLYAKTYNTFIKLIDPNYDASKELAELREIDISKIRYREFLKLPFAKSGRFELIPTKLSSLFNESGNPHNFNVLILDDGTELVKKNRKYYKNGQYVRLTGKINVVDKKDSTTGIIKSQTNKLDENKIDEIIKTKTLIDNFYEFFKNRCPVDNLHEFNNDNICNKCGMNVNKKDEEIYKKYKHKYDEFIAIDSNVTFEHIKTPPIPVSATDFKTAIDNADSNVYKVAKLFSVQPTQITYIGQYEGRELDKIKNGEYDPAVIVGKYHPILSTLENYILLTIRSYYTMKNYNRMRSLKRFDQLVTNIDKALLGHLPELTLFDNGKYARMVLSGEDLYKYYLGILCEIILFIYNIDIDSLSQFVKPFATFLFSEILAAEEYKLKVTRVSFNMEDTYDEIEDENYTIKEKEIDDEEETLFNGLDIDEDNDEDNDIKVTGYGLD